MEVFSAAQTPGTRALLGDYAIRQNEANRGDPDLDGAMDNGLSPVHLSWSALWAGQQRAEASVGQAVVMRDEAGRVLHRTLSVAYRQLEYTLGKGSPALPMYFPEGRLAFARRSLAEQLSLLPPYVAALVDPGCPLPEQLRVEIDGAFQGARSAQQRLEALQGEAREAQRARAAQDEGWDSAYRAYHRAVEWKMGGDRGLIQTLIKATPRPAPRASTTTASAPA